LRKRKHSDSIEARNHIGWRLDRIAHHHWSNKSEPIGKAVFQLFRRAGGVTPSTPSREERLMISKLLSYLLVRPLVA
jgi:hypothetical protein